LAEGWSEEDTGGGFAELKKEKENVSEKMEIP